MNRLVIIGNGFDMAHGLKTSYKDFINWYCNQLVDAFSNNVTRVSKDRLCKFIIKDNSKYSCWNIFFYQKSGFRDFNHDRVVPGFDIIQEIKNNPDDFSFECTPFFNTLLQSIEKKRWVDIECDYYYHLKECIEKPECNYTVKDLNDQLTHIQEKLVEYLKTISINNFRNDLYDAMIDYFQPEDFSTEGRQKAQDYIGLNLTTYDRERISDEERMKLIPQRIMLLSFNYTNTVRKFGNFNITHNYIHGELEHPENIIFGYGDELDKKYQDILDMNDNEILRHAKSDKYLETRRYREMLEFIQEAPFQVFIMGHSCGISDRTLLNTVFEHENCVSIKPFYHIGKKDKDKDKDKDNYLDIVQNISRSFTNMKLFRDRVVNKEQCLTM